MKREPVPVPAGRSTHPAFRVRLQAASSCSKTRSTVAWRLRSPARMWSHPARRVSRRIPPGSGRPTRFGERQRDSVWCGASQRGPVQCRADAHDDARGSRVVLGVSPGLTGVFPRVPCCGTSRLPRGQGVRDRHRKIQRTATGRRPKPPGAHPRTALPSDGAHRTATHADETAGALCSIEDAGSPLRDRCNARNRRATVNQTTQSKRFSAAKPWTRSP